MNDPKHPDVLSTRPPSPDRLAILPQHFKAVLSKPFKLLPPAVQPVALKVWMCYRHLQGMEHALAITGLLSVWLNDWGLLEEDAVTILNDSLSPEHAAKHRFGNDVTATLAKEVSHWLAHRRIEREQAERRAADEKAKTTAAPADELRAMIGNIGMSPLD